METPELLAQGEMDQQVPVVDRQLRHRAEHTGMGADIDRPGSGGTLIWAGSLLVPVL
ncbi:MAG: hypothetical protein M3Y33_05215 [Actinomycetota bacterium]|nr:hypothetical protein [Actinomycetota bacterium]